MRMGSQPFHQGRPRSRPHNAEPPRPLKTGSGLKAVAFYPHEGVRYGSHSDGKAPR
ncbi:PTS fructose transporter [Cutibacterium acnes]